MIDAQLLAYSEADSWMLQEIHEHVDVYVGGVNALAPNCPLPNPGKPDENTR